MPSLSAEAKENHLSFTKPPSYLLLWRKDLLEAASLHLNKISRLKAGGSGLLCEWYKCCPI